MVKHFANKDCIYTKDTIGVPMTPSRWVGKPKYKKVTRLKMSCGGGMGGSTWYEIIDRIDLDELTKNETLIVKNYEGDTIFLNRKYIVKAIQLTLVTAILDSQNSNYPVGKHEYNWLVEDEKKITLIDEFDSY